MSVAKARGSLADQDETSEPRTASASRTIRRPSTTELVALIMAAGGADPDTHRDRQVQALHALAGGGVPVESSAGGLTLANCDQHARRPWSRPELTSRSSRGNLPVNPVLDQSVCPVARSMATTARPE